MTGLRQRDERGDGRWKPKNKITWRNQEGSILTTFHGKKNRAAQTKAVRSGRLKKGVPLTDSGGRQNASGGV